MAVRVVFDKNIKLLKIIPKYGYNGGEDVTAASVRGSVGVPSLTTKEKAANIGIRTDYVAQIWRRDFEKDRYTHVEYDGIRYRIESVSAGMCERIVKLILSRE